MLVFCLLIVLVLIILIVTIFASSINNCTNIHANFLNKFKKNIKPNKKNTKPNKKEFTKPNKKEHYGPPPGRQPAVNHLLMGYRGWPSAPYSWTSNTASAILNRVEPWPEYKYQTHW